MKQGLALCGGGSLGAYEMGVWAYLRERDFRFDVITGTSIGAINGAMIAADSYEVAKKMWDHVTVEDIMKNGINFDRDLIGEIDLKKGSKWKTFVNGYIKNKGANTEPLEKMLQEYIPPLRVNHLKKPKLGIIKCSFPGMKEVKVLVNKLKDDEVVAGGGITCRSTIASNSAPSKSSPSCSIPFRSPKSKSSSICLMSP